MEQQIIINKLEALVKELKSDIEEDKTAEWENLDTKSIPDDIFTAKYEFYELDLDRFITSSSLAYSYVLDVNVNLILRKLKSGQFEYKYRYYR